MPDRIEETPLLVEGTKEYRRNALVMIVGGVGMLAFWLAMWIFTGRVFIFLPFIALYVIALGAKRFFERSDNES